MQSRRQTHEQETTFIAAKAIFAVTVALFVLSTLFSGDCAYADMTSAAAASSSSQATLADFSLSNVLGYIQGLITFVFLPIAILICAGKIIYVGVAGYIMGDDFLNVSDKWYGKSVEDHPDECLKMSLKNFAYGLAWIAGVWVVFTLVIQITSMLVGTIATSGMF